MTSQIADVWSRIKASSKWEGESPTILVRADRAIGSSRRNPREVEHTGRWCRCPSLQYHSRDEALRLRGKAPVARYCAFVF